MGRPLTNFCARLFPDGGGRRDIGWLYAMGTLDGLVKVGMTINPRARFNTHRGTYRERLAWFHLGPRSSHDLVQVAERLALSNLAGVATRIRRTETFTGVSRAMATALLRQSLAKAVAAHLSYNEFVARCHAKEMSLLVDEDDA